MAQSKKFWHNQYTIPILVAFLIPSFVWGVTTIGESIVTGGQLTVSGTATSTIAGDVNFDSGTLFIDSINNRVGFGTTTPGVAVHVASTSKLQIGDAGSGWFGGKLRIIINDGESENQAIKAHVSRTTGTNYGFNGTASGVGADTNIGLYAWASGATANWGMYVHAGDAYVASGKLAMATSTPWGRVSIKGASSYPSLVVSDSSNNTDFVVMADGKVGVGTASPEEVFQVSGNAKVTKLNITSGVSATNEELNVYGDAWFYTNNPTISFGNSLSQGTKLSGGNAEETILQATKASGDYGISLKTGVSPTTYLRINQSGLTGIGTTAPESKLQVTGGGLCVGSDANCNSDNNTEGTVYAATTAMTTYDLAENYPTKDTTLKAGDVVALDTDQNGPYVKRAESGDVIIGAISAEPGALLGGFNGAQYAHEKQVPVALSGRIDVKVSTENGNIKSGDYLELSSIPGVAAKATGQGKVIGIALESYSGEGVGEVLVFVELRELQEITALKNEIAELRALVESLR